jgi:serine/threonine protein kinase/tetratricopeptide (TPR) repeat protein
MAYNPPRHRERVMTPERWRQVKEICGAVLDHASEQRDGLLAQLCEGDAELMREVEDMLEKTSTGDSILDGPVEKLAITSGFTPGTILADRYRIVGLLGRGGMGEVYRADDLKLGQPVALKFLPTAFASDPAHRERFIAEVRITRQLSHPNICRVYDIGEFEGHHFLSMEYIDGEDLASLIKRIGYLPNEKAVDVMRQLIAGLAAAHERGILHRDLKPANIMLDGHGRVRITDFGIAIAAEDMQEGQISGTPAYMAPEQLNGQAATVRSDIYSLGLVLYEIYCGKKAFTGSTIAELREEKKRRPVAPSAIRPGVDPNVERLILNCLEYEPNARPSSVEQLAGTLPGGERPARKWRRAKVFIPTGVLAATAIVGALLLRAPRAAALTEQDVILLADFDNKTGDPVFDDTLKQATEFALEQSPFLSLFPEESVRQTLRLMERPADERITNQVAREVCQRAGLKAVLDGSIAPLGNNYVITLKAESCAAGKSLAGEQREASSKEQVLTELGRAATSLRAKLGESLGSLQKFDKPLEATTSSLEALQNYTEGHRLYAAGDYLRAVPFLRQAIDLDPNFAGAYDALGFVYVSMGNQSLARQSAAKAFELREHASERERLMIAGSYYFGLGDLKNAIETLEPGKKIFAREAFMRFTLAAVYARAGRFEDALVEDREAVRLDPISVIQRNNLANHLLLLNRFDEAKKVVREAIEQRLDSPGMRRFLARIAFMDGGSEALQREIEAAKDRGPANPFWLGRGAACSGKITETASLVQEIRTRFRESPGGADSGNSTVEAAFSFIPPLLGIQDSSNRLSQIFKSLPPGIPMAPERVLGMALSGDSKSAQTLIDEMQKESPQDTLLNFVWIPTIKAVLEIRAGHADQAIDLLRSAAPYEPSEASLAAIYVRGWAYLENKSGPEAAAEFQKIIDHRGVALFSPFYPLSHLGLGRAYALAGDLPKARKSYEDFFAIWKDADPDIPILIQAKKEYAKLPAN